MKKKLIVILICAAAVAGTFFALRAILGNLRGKTALAVPEGVRLEGHALVWQAVSKADSYEVEVGGEIRAATRSRLPLKYGDNGKTVRVRALADDRAASEFSGIFTVAFSKETLNGLTVTYALKQLGISRKEFIDGGIPVSVSPEDYTAYGYEFLFWYYSGDGDKKPVNTPFISWKSVVLLAEARPIDYSVSFVLPEGFEFEGLPSVYNAENVSSLAAITAEKDGYIVDGWRIGSENGAILTAETVVTGDITLYPRVSLKTAGLVFEKSSGGYALKGYAGEDTEITVPAYYLGERVTDVLGGAIDGGRAPNIEKITFCGDVVLAENAIGACPKLNAVIFGGDLTARENSVYVAGDVSSASALSVYIFGSAPEVAFIAGYLGLPADKRVDIYVAESFVSALAEAFAGDENVTVYVL